MYATVKELKNELNECLDDATVSIHSHYDSSGDIVKTLLIVDATKESKEKEIVLFLE